MTKKSIIRYTRAKAQPNVKRAPERQPPDIPKIGPDRGRPSNVISRKTSSGKGEVTIFRRLNWTNAMLASSEIHKLFSEGVNNITINLRNIISADEKGIIPLVAVCDKKRLDGCRFHLVTPQDHDVRATFKNHGWSAYLLGVVPENKKRLSRTTGLVKFDSPEDLNKKMNDALGVCIKGTVFNPTALKSFEWAFSEILDNVLTHSGVGYGFFEVTWGMNGRVSFTVCDCGEGIPKNIKSAFKRINSDQDAIAKAIEKGITSTREGQGNGLAGTINIIHDGDGSLTINSGYGTLNIQDGVTRTSRQTIPFKGTFVNFVLPSKTEINLEAALWGYEVYSFTDYGFEDDEGSGLSIKLREHGERFGNRPTGRELRNILLNLTAQHPNSRITIDFEGVEIISSSFGDEFLGKFASDRGIVYFSQAIRLKNLSVFVASTLNHVISQRLYQDYARSKGLPLNLTDEQALPEVDIPRDSV